MIGIGALSETRLAGTSQLEKVEGRYVHLWSCKSSNEVRQSGGGFVIKSHLARKLSPLHK